jgi:hypothetical protein
MVLLGIIHPVRPYSKILWHRTLAQHLWLLIPPELLHVLLAVCAAGCSTRTPSTTSS